MDIEHRGPQCLLTLGRSTSPPLDQFPVRVCSCPLCVRACAGATDLYLHSRAAVMNLNHVLKLSNLYSNGERYHARPLGNSKVISHAEVVQHTCYPRPVQQKF